MEAKGTVMSNTTKRQFRYIPSDPSQDVSTWDIDGAIQLQAKISFEAGIKEGVRRAYQFMVDQHYVVGYDLDHAVNFLEKKYGNKD